MRRACEHIPPAASGTIPRMLAAPPANETTRRARADIQLQRRHDHKRGADWPLYDARVRAVQEARAAVDAGEQGAKYALRQALIDLAACTEQLAAKMRAPTVSSGTDQR